MGMESKASLDRLSLSMMSKTYFFELTNPLHPLSKTIGNARVTAVLINENSPPELLLHQHDEHPAFHCIDQLVFSTALPVAV